jgi:hypothetical protein
VKLKPWQIAPYELLKHGEQHRESGGSFDLRMALISYDNAIELSITTYLGLHPDQRSNVQLSRDQVEKWKRNYHSKLQFLEEHVTRTLSQSMEIERCDIIHFHTVRNKLYHEGGAFVPHSEDVTGIRTAALWTFKILFETDAEALLARENTSASVDIGNTRRPDPLAKLDGMVLSIRKDFDLLRAALAPLLQSPATNEQIVAKALGAEDPAVSDTLQEAFRKAEKIANALGDEKEVRAEPKEIHELNKLLQELKDRLDVPLRRYQENLAESAAKASIEAIDRGSRLIGNIYQPSGSGMFITMAAYLSLITQHSRFRDFTILVVADRSMLAEQYYQRMRATLPARDRVVFRLTPENLAREARSGSATIGVGTIQSLRFETASELLPEKTLIIGMGFDVSTNACAVHLRNAYMISFSSSFRRAISSQPLLIAAYSFSQALQDGYMTPARLSQVSLPALERPDPVNLALEDLLTTGDETFPTGAARALSVSQVKAVVAHVLEHLLARPSGVAKALVIVASIVEAEHFRQALVDEAYSMRNTDVRMRELTVFALTSQRSVTDTASDLGAFTLSEFEPSILVCAKMWASVDLSFVHGVYITCQLSAAELRRLVEKLSGLRPGKEPPIVVDYARNRFAHLYG